jgi:cysteinyl-tRNA synthetase
MSKEINTVTIYNTPDRKRVPLIPHEQNKITMYSCGPTVYNTVHIGNLRSILNFDVVSRALRYLGYDLKRVVNFTDVGHMSSDSDFGEDKVERQAQTENSEPIKIANKYITEVITSFKKLNILNPNGTGIDSNLDVENTSKQQWANLGWARATDYIEEMIELIKLIEKNGHTYQTDQALYFNISTFPQYSEFSGQKLDEKQIAVRNEVKEDPQKKNPADFVLWMKRSGKYKNHMMHWSSPWGDGFPGWHIECSTMGWKLLGEYIDIHTGGTDLIPVHHSNEVAQNYGAFKHHLVKYWLHNEFVYSSTGDKFSKSKHNALTLKEIEDLNIPLMALRWYYLTSSYKAPMKFSIDSLKSSEKSYFNIINKLKEINNGNVGEISEKYIEKFKDALRDNFNTPKVLALLNEIVKSKLKPEDILTTVFEIDKVLGLDIEKTVLTGDTQKREVPVSEVEDPLIKEILLKRESARNEKNWNESDKLRDELLKNGYKVLDKQDGQYVIRI